MAAGLHRQRVTRIVALAVAAAGLLWLVRAGYLVPWTGFGPRLDTSGAVVAPYKTLWDWLDLLVVPALIGFGVLFLEASRKRAERTADDDRMEQRLLDDYIAAMTTMMLSNDFEDRPHPARTIARTRTLMVLRLVNGNRKTQVLQFLYECGLVGQNPVISLIGADFSRAQLQEAPLKHAEIRGANFRDASFQNATLTGTSFHGCDFSGADFTGATLEGAKLEGANLTNARIANETLRQAVTEGATLPHGATVVPTQGRSAMEERDG